MTLSRAIIATATLAMVVTAGCSGDDDGTATESSTTSEAPTTTEVPPSTSDAPTTTDAPPSTTDAAATTERPAATTEPPATDPPLMSEAAVEATLIAIQDELTECARQLPNCDAAATASAHGTGEFRDGTFASLSNAVEQGIRAENVDSRIMFVESVQLDVATREASAVTCEHDGAILIGPDGTIVDDDYVSRRYRWLLILQNDRWLASNTTLMEEANGEGNRLCDE